MGASPVFASAFLIQRKVLARSGRCIRQCSSSFMIICANPILLPLGMTRVGRECLVVWLGIEQPLASLCSCYTLCHHPCPSQTSSVDVLSSVKERTETISPRMSLGILEEKKTIIISLSVPIVYSCGSPECAIHGSPIV